MSGASTTSEPAAASPAYPGDELIADARFETTWSTEIGCPPHEVWPWLVQMGYQRAGWYVDAWWDKAINEHFWPRIVAREHRAEHFAGLDHIDEELQTLHIGEVIPDGPPGSAWFTVEILDPPRALVLRSDRHLKLLTPARWHDSKYATHGTFSWAFLLDPLAAGRCRLTIRTRATMTPRFVAALLVPVLELVDRAFVRRMLRGIKRRAEANPPA